MSPIILARLWQEDDTITIPLYIDPYPAMRTMMMLIVGRKEDDMITILLCTEPDIYWSTNPHFPAPNPPQSIAAGRVNGLNDLSHRRPLITIQTRCHPFWFSHNPQWALAQRLGASFGQTHWFQKIYCAPCGGISKLPCGGISKLPCGGISRLQSQTGKAAD